MTSSLATVELMSVDKTELESMINAYGDAMYSLACQYERGTRATLEEAKQDLEDLRVKFEAIGISLNVSAW